MVNWLNKKKSDFRFFWFLIKIQWVDRLATSAFLIGITLQTFLLCLSIYKISESYAHALSLAIRSTLLSTIGMTLLSSMSNIQNEFRFGTIESICLSRFSFKKLILFRCISMAMICSPAIIFPFVIVALKFGYFVNLIFFLIILLLYILIILAGVQTTFILNAFEVPLNAVPWVKAILLIVGLELVKFPYSGIIAQAFPSYWVIKLSQGQNIIHSLLGFVLSAIVSTVFIQIIFNKDLDKKIENNFLTGRMT